MTQTEIKILNKTIRIIVDYINPEKVILFGSRAKNKNANENDDYDNLSGRAAKYL